MKNAEDEELEEEKAAKVVSDSGGALDEMNAVLPADCLDGGLGITGAGGPITDDDDMLFERLEQVLDCEAIGGEAGKC